MRIPILCEMERISDFRSNMGIRDGIFRRWRYANKLQTTTSTVIISKMPFLRLSKSTPNLHQQSSTTLRLTAEQNNRNCTRLEEMIEGWEKEYYYMDHPIKPQQKPRPIPTIIVQRPLSNTPTIDKILASLFTTK